MLILPLPLLGLGSKSTSLSPGFFAHRPRCKIWFAGSRFSFSIVSFFLVDCLGRWSQYICLLSCRRQRMPTLKSTPDPKFKLIISGKGWWVSGWLIWGCGWGYRAWVSSDNFLFHFCSVVFGSLVFSVPFLRWLEHDGCYLCLFGFLHFPCPWSLQLVTSAEKLLCVVSSYFKTQLSDHYSVNFLWKTSLLCSQPLFRMCLLDTVHD